MHLRLLLSIVLLIVLVSTLQYLVSGSTEMAITAENLEELMAQGDDLQIVDVRQPHEFAAGHIPGALSMPLFELDDHMHELDKDIPVIVICLTDSRSSKAVAQLIEAGFDARMLKGGMVKWHGEVVQPSDD